MPTILLADDHDIVRRGMRGLLELEPDLSVCAEASDGRRAVELAAEFKPDIAIVDYSLPLLNGVEVVRQIAKISPSTQMLMFTHHDSDAVMREACKAGARGFLIKTEASEHLLLAIRSLSQRRPYFTGRISEAMLESFLGQPAPDTVLSGREREVVQLIAEGKGNKEVARLLNLSVKTVETHRAAAMRKIGVKTLGELFRYAVRNHLIQA